MKKSFKNQEQSTFAINKLTNVAKTETSKQPEDKKALQQPPEWDLSILFKGIDDPEISNTKKKISDTIEEMIDDKDLIPKMKDYELLSFIRKYETVMELSRSLSYFASLNLCTQRDNPEALLFEKKTEEFIERIFDGISWIHHQLYILPVETKVTFLQSQKLKSYQEWLMCELLLPPALSYAVAKAVRQMTAIGKGWFSLYKQMSSQLNFIMGKKTYTLDEISHMAHHHKDKATRDKALKVMSTEFSRLGYIFSQTLNSIYKEEDVITKIQLNDDEECSEISFDALDTDGFSNGLNREDILAIASAVTDSYVPISQRFYKLLAKLQGKEAIDYNDRLQNPVEITEKKVTWPECVEFVLNTLLEFNTVLGLSGVNIVNSNIIHAKPLKGKDTGAFCVRGDRPFIFLNYRDDFDSVLTFAHEFGHAVHHLYSEQNAGLLNDCTSISMSEVASIFNEKLIFNKYLSNPELSNKEKLHLLIEDVNRQIADIHRQIAFSKFELRAFRERQKGELSTERFTQIYCEEMQRYLGFPLQDDAKFSWMAVPHFFNTPFYVRYYAFAGLIVNKLWDVYSNEKVEDFPSRYADMLTNTGLEDIDSLLEPFELDMTSPTFWSSALEPISAQIDEIERLAKIEGFL